MAGVLEVTAQGCVVCLCSVQNTKPFPAAQSLGFNAKGFVQGTRRRVRRLEERVQKEGVRTSLTRW